MFRQMIVHGELKSQSNSFIVSPMKIQWLLQVLEELAPVIGGVRWKLQRLLNVFDVRKVHKRTDSDSSVFKTKAECQEQRNGSHPNSDQSKRPDLLPPRVQIEPGRHKYVLVRASSSAGDDYWFVKSASPRECGGAYHADVAEDLVEWIKAAGFEDVHVTGGGRIDYVPETSTVKVYGFSYQFGRGDHAKVASLVEHYWKDSRSSASSIRVLVDTSTSLY